MSWKHILFVWGSICFCLGGRAVTSVSKKDWAHFWFNTVSILPPFEVGGVASGIKGLKRFQPFSC